MNQASLIIVLAMLTMVGVLGIDMPLPAFHAIGSEFQVAPLVVQQTLSVYVACMSFTMLLSGTLSDSFGRRRVLIVSLIGFALTSLAAALASNSHTLILVRALQGLSAGAGLVVSRAMVQDLFKGAEAQRVMATVTMVFGLAPALAPIVGGWLLNLINWRAIFVFMAIFSAMLWLVCQRGLPESLPPSQRSAFHFREIVARYRESLSHRGFLLMIIAIALMFAGTPLYIGSAPEFVMNILGLPVTAFGWLFIPMIAGTMGGSWMARRLARKVAAEKLLHIGLWIMLLAALANVGYCSLGPVQLPWAVLPLLFYNFGMGLIMPSAILRALSIFPHMRGLSASLQSFVQMMSFSLITGFVAPILYHSALMIAIGMLVLFVAGVLLWQVAMRFSADGVAPHAAPSNPTAPR